MYVKLKTWVSMGSTSSFNTLHQAIPYTNIPYGMNTNIINMLSSGKYDTRVFKTRIIKHGGQFKEFLEFLVDTITQM